MKKFRVLLRVELVLIYLVVLAGSVVRMTGSGMGCPDWPKCFGYLIPPTERAQLNWQGLKQYHKGEIIIVNENLRVAKADFTTEKKYNPSNWAPYTKHDYALFDAFHTWTEYINRLIGALAGIPMLLLFILSLLYLKRKPLLVLLSFLGLFLLGFEAWLGKLVVDGNLIPGSITIHMMGALAIILVLLVFLSRVSAQKATIALPNYFIPITAIAIIFGLAQIILGTQVREQVDVLHSLNVSRSNWVNKLDWAFYVHRSFSILIILCNAWLWIKGKNDLKIRPYLNILMGIILLEVLMGITLSYFEFPKFAQPAHLLLGTLMFGVQVQLLLLVSKARSVLVTPHKAHP